MNEKALIEKMTGLLQMSTDAVYSYKQAVPKIEDEIMRDRLDAFRQSHETHIQELSRIIAQLSGKSPEVSKDLKGYIIGGVSALRSMSGTKGALKALQTTEEMTNRTYGEAVSWDVAESAHDLLRKQFSDVKIHLDYINSNLKALS